MVLFVWSHADRGLTCLLFLYIFYDGFSLSQWTGTLDWTTGLTYFWFLHILWLAKLLLAESHLNMTSKTNYVYQLKIVLSAIEHLYTPFTFHAVQNIVNVLLGKLKIVNF